MKRNRLHVLVVDDDVTQGSAIREAFERMGYQSTWCATSVQALNTAQRMEFHCLVVDCMLPRMNGVDLVEEILQFIPKRPQVFLMSGIFKDRAFIKDASERTQAQAFFIKPFSIVDLTTQVDQVLAKASTERNDPPLLRLYSQVPIPDEEFVDLIHLESTVHAVHLPVIYRRLQRSRLTGELTLQSSQGGISTVSVFEGQIFSVQTPDKDTFFGGLAVGLGFVSPEDVLNALQNPEQKRLGQKLIESFALSPHAIHLIIEEQLALRLSQTVQNEVVTLKWNPHKFPAPDNSLPPARFDLLLADWTLSKIDPLAIKSNFVHWGAYSVTGDFHPTLKETITLDQLFSATEFDEAEHLPYLLRQLLSGGCHLETQASGYVEGFEFLHHRLNQLMKDFKTHNYFQMLGVGEKAQSLELNRAYGDLKSNFDPGNLDPDCPQEIVAKATFVYQQIETAYKTLSDDLNRARYLLTLNNQRAQLMLENEPIFRVGIMELQKGQAKSAGKHFQSLLDRKLEFKDLRAYRIWAGLKAERQFTALTLEQVPPEERHSAPYFMAKGVYHKTKGQIKKALESFRAAHVLDPRLTIARMELELMRSELESKNQSRAVLKEVTMAIDALFGRSRRGA